MSSNELLELRKAAVRVRKNIVRMIAAGKQGHLGGALSMADIITALYFKIMRIDPKNPGWPQRDRLVLSAGHKCLGLYAVLAERGFFDAELLDTYGKLHSKLPGHPNMHKLPGVETNTGALGHGLSIGGGMALGLKHSGSDARVFVIMGDGELPEGSNWEAAGACRKFQLDNILVFVDRNGLQIGGTTAEIMSCEPLADRWKSFGWQVREIDGHDMNEIVEAATAAPFSPGAPSVVIANTVKAKGLSFGEGKTEFHYWKATTEGVEQAMQELLEAERSLAS